jgi:hypothetical protein
MKEMNAICPCFVRHSILDCLPLSPLSPFSITRTVAPLCRRPTFSVPSASPWCLSVFVLLSLLLPGCSAYHFGTRSLYPAEIHTVYVPVFESASMRRNLGERLTEAVCKEITNRTPYKVVNDPEAESVLTGKLVGEGKRVLVRSITGDPRDVEVNLVVRVTWLDRRGGVIREPQAIPLPNELAEISGTNEVIPELGQSITTAQQKAIERMAQQIVGLMEAPW